MDTHLALAAKQISSGIKGKPEIASNAKRYTAETQRSVGVKFVFAEGKRKTRRAHFILEDQFRGRAAQRRVTAFASQSETFHALLIQRSRACLRRGDGGEAPSARPPARTIPIKQLRNWMIHNYRGASSHHNYRAGK